MLAHVFADFQANMWLYISIPFISGIIGYVTKVVAIKMMFAPMDFMRKLVLESKILQNSYALILIGD